MEQRANPSKDQVRKYMESRQAQRTAPPSIEEIRRQLGWIWLNNPARAR